MSSLCEKDLLITNSVETFKQLFIGLLSVFEVAEYVLVSLKYAPWQDLSLSVLYGSIWFRLSFICLYNDWRKYDKITDPPNSSSSTHIFLFWLISIMINFQMEMHFSVDLLQNAYICKTWTFMHTRLALETSTIRSNCFYKNVNY